MLCEDIWKRMETFGTAAILAGGRSSRMGFDKQLLQIGEQRLIAMLLPKLSACFSDIVVVTKLPALYKNMPVRTVQDIIPDKGPLSGIHAALSIARSDYVYMMACDMPCFSAEYCGYMRARLLSHPADACVTRFGDWIEPFHAFYNRRMIEVVRGDLNADKTSVHYLLKEVDTLYIPEAEARAFSPDWSLFLNLNTREKYEAFMQTLE